LKSPDRRLTSELVGTAGDVTRIALYMNGSTQLEEKMEFIHND
jgi:hypothetical protein